MTLKGQILSISWNGANWTLIIDGFRKNFETIQAGINWALEVLEKGSDPGKVEKLRQDLVKLILLTKDH